MLDVINMKSANPIWDKIKALTVQLDKIDISRDPKAAKKVWIDIDFYLDYYNDGKRVDKKPRKS